MALKSIDKKFNLELKIDGSMENLNSKVALEINEKVEKAKSQYWKFINRTRDTEKNLIKNHDKADFYETKKSTI